MIATDLYLYDVGYTTKLGNIILLDTTKTYATTNPYYIDKYNVKIE